MSVRDRLREFWPHDDSPGFTDYPRYDIRGHRFIARWNRRTALVVFFGGLWYASTTSEPAVPAAFALALAASCYAASNGMRLEALEWELQLEREDGDEQ